MWKKEEAQKKGNTENIENILPKRNVSKKIKSQQSINSSRSIIGKNLIIKGEVLGNDDVTIHGKLEGTIKLKENTVNVGKGADINANISVKNIKVDGKITGDINAYEKILVTEKGNVTGNITSPRVVLNDGAIFKGNISMKKPNSLVNEKESTLNKIIGKNSNK